MSKKKYPDKIQKVNLIILINKSLQNKNCLLGISNIEEYSFAPANEPSSPKEKKNKEKKKDDG